MLTRARIDLDNHIRGVLKAFGLKVGKVATGQFEARVWALTDEACGDSLDCRHAADDPRCGREPARLLHRAVLAASAGAR
jgi:hypothetical protein